MKTAIITISEDVINAVIRPISMFLNDVPENTVFTHVHLQKDSEYKLDDGKTPTFVFSSSNGGLFKFTMYDLKRFKVSEKMFLDSFLPTKGKKAVLTLKFTALKCEPTLVKGTEDKYQYPPFCYEYYKDFEIARKAVNDANELLEANGKLATERIAQSEFDALHSSAIIEGAEDRYYRTLTVDQPLVTYADVK